MKVNRSSRRGGPLSHFLGPILFARRVAGGMDQTSGRAAWALAAVAGTGLLGAQALIWRLDPGMPKALFAQSVDVATLALADAVVLSDFTRLRNKESQAAQCGYRVVWESVIGLVTAVLAFDGAAPRFSVRGRIWACSSARA